MNDLATRDALLNAALEYTASMKGKARDRAVFDYLAGGALALSISDPANNTSLPPWLFVLGCRGGDRVQEITRMLTNG